MKKIIIYLKRWRVISANKSAPPTRGYIRLAVYVKTKNRSELSYFYYLIS